MKTSNKLIIGTLIIVIFGFVYSQVRTDTSTPSTVKLGAVLALSGYAANDGENIKNGIELARADLAKKNIIVDIEYFDDATDPKKTVAGVGLMNDKGVKSIFGPTWSYQVSAALPVLETNNMTAFIADTSSDVVDGGASSTNIIHGVPKIAAIEKPSAEWLKERKLKNVAIIALEGTWGVVHTNAWTNAAREAGATVVSVNTITYANAPQEMPGIIVKAKAAGADGILWTGNEADAIVMIKQMKTLNYNVPVLGPNFLDLVVKDGKVEASGLNLYMIESARSAKFITKYKAVYGEEPNKYAESSYDLTMIAVEAEMKKGKESSRDYVLSKEHKGFDQKYRFDNAGDIVNGEWFVTKI